MCGTHAKRRRYHPRSGVRVTRRALIPTFLRRGARWRRTGQRGREKSIRGIFDRITIETNDGVSYNMRTTMAAETRESIIFFFSHTRVALNFCCLPTDRTGMFAYALSVSADNVNTTTSWAAGSPCAEKRHERVFGRITIDGVIGAWRRPFGREAGDRRIFFVQERI